MSTLVVAGCNVPNCPTGTIYEANERCFRIMLVEDAISGLYERARQETVTIGMNAMRTHAHAHRHGCSSAARDEGRSALERGARAYPQAGQLSVSPRLTARRKIINASGAVIALEEFTSQMQSSHVASFTAARNATSASLEVIDPIGGAGSPQRSG